MADPTIMNGTRPVAGRAGRMGYQPGLDGLRALSVVLVILYHAGVARHAELGAGTHAWFFDGGFLGVEVFFVVSGFLITSLLLEERATHGRITLRQFWLRRFRRLLPALWVMIAAAGVWATFWGHDYLADLKADSFFGLFYGANFQQLANKVSYFGGFPHLLRHLWSLAVEEHFYLFFPLMFVVVLRRPGTPSTRLLRVSLPAAIASAVALIVMWQAPVERLTDNGVQLDDVRQNWAYLSTFTRIGGILFGVSLAVVWSPWKSRPRADPRRLDVAGLAAVGGIVAAALLLKSDSPVLYRGGLTAVSLLSVVAIAAVVHPEARLMRTAFGHPAMAAVGRRSYGLYLWHWPIFVGPLAGRSIGARLLIGGAATVVMSELCYRFVETPIRKGAVSRWFRTVTVARVRRRPGWRGLSAATVACTAGLALLAGSLVVRLVTFDRAATGVGGTAVAEAFDPTALVTRTTAASTTAPSSTSTEPTLVGAVAAGPTTTLLFGEGRTPANAPPLPPPGEQPAVPRHLAILGDSQGKMLFGARPSGLAGFFKISGGALSGCSVFDEGKIVSSQGYSTKFDRCAGWQTKWSDAVTKVDADLALVVLGAWDVFDLQLADRTLTFGSPEFDRYWLARLQIGIDAIKRSGAQVALLEVECMRPQDVKGQGVPPLPERADDARTGHINELLASAAAADPSHVFYVPSPKRWCDNNDPVARDTEYRWDGVHVSGKGAKLVFETIIPSLQAIPNA